MRILARVIGVVVAASALKGVSATAILAALPPFLARYASAAMASATTYYYTGHAELSWLKGAVPLEWMSSSGATLAFIALAVLSLFVRALRILLWWLTAAMLALVFYLLYQSFAP